VKILIVDDAKETRESLHNIIKMKIDASFEIQEAEDGQEALAIVDTFKPNIILTDILMPKMDGIRFTELIKSNPQTRDIFIAAITGLSGDEQIQKIYASGVDFYIAKPFQLDDIVARIKVITSLITKKGSVPEEKPSVVYNSFNDENIKHYFTTFSITQEDDIFLIFDYFSKQNVKYNSIALKDFMVTLVKTYREIEGENKKFDLIIEESDTFIYITIEDALFIQAIEYLVKKHTNLVKYKRKEDTISFRINIRAFLFTPKRILIDDVDKYKDELISAAELMENCSQEVLQEINTIEEALLDYRAIHEENYKYVTSLNLVLVKLFDNYAKLFKKVPEFDRVLIALQSVAVLIKESNSEKFDSLINSKLINNIEELNIIVETWIQNVIVNQDSHDIHDNDSKIMDICKVIEESFS